MPNTETREEFLDWAKKRALAYLDRGDLRNAVVSMCSDLKKNPRVYDANTPAVIALCQLGIFKMDQGAAEVRYWIEDFR